MACKYLRVGNELQEMAAVNDRTVARCIAKMNSFACPKQRLRYQISAQCWRFEEGMSEMPCIQNLENHPYIAVAKKMRTYQHGFIKKHKKCGGIVRYVESLDPTHYEWDAECLACGEMACPEDIKFEKR